MWAALAGVAVVFLSKAYLFSTKYNRAAADRTVLGLNILLLSESATKSTRETSDTTGGPCADVAYTRFHDTDTAARASVEDKPPRMHSTADDVREGVSTSGQRYKTITAKGMDRLNLEAGMALFFGAFAYFAVNFFFAPDREIADPYLLFCRCGRYTTQRECVGVFASVGCVLNRVESLSDVQTNIKTDGCRRKSQTQIADTKDSYMHTYTTTHIRIQRDNYTHTHTKRQVHTYMGIGNRTRLAKIGKCKTCHLRTKFILCAHTWMPGHVVVQHLVCI
eukprot:m.49840 g.49840  ORF g.49840 m.49840 type:complete len:278 (-) comp15342_c0_seq7:2513-3346(-)